MESKDLKNSDELMRPNNDDTLLTNDPESDLITDEKETDEAEVIEESATLFEKELINQVAENEVEAESENLVLAEAESTPELEKSTSGDVTFEPIDVEQPEINDVTDAPVTFKPEELAKEVDPDSVIAEELPVVTKEEDSEISETDTKEDTDQATKAQEHGNVEETAVVQEPEVEKVKTPDATIVEPVENEDHTFEAEEVEEEDEPDQVDYSQFSQIELINLLRDLIDSGQQSDRTINLIIAAFNQKVKDNFAEKKKKFEDKGGNPDNFSTEEDPYENDIRELIKKYRQVKFEQAKKMEAEKEINLKKKYAIIEDIKNLLNTEESINKTFQEFRELQKQWYELGPVPQAKMKDLWDTYHFHVENFYDYIKINKELRDLDLKKNLEMKINLCEKAEELLLETSVFRSFNTLQKFHEQWREIGPVPRDKKDDIWERFKAVTTAINQKHQEFFDKRKNEQKRNLEAKIALCEKVEEICAMTLESHRDWDEKSKQLIELQKVWRTIGFAPKRDNNKIYDRFRNACDLFFNKKRDFYSQNKELQNKNMQMKIDLCMEAETLKVGTDWKKTTQQFIDIQKRWKEIGPVPRKNSDILWKRFRAACDYFFERKSLHFSDIDDEQANNLKLKKALIAEVEAFKPGSDVSESLMALREFQRRWTEIGHVPMKEKDVLQNKFRIAINKHFDALKVDSGKRDSINFRSKIANMTENQKGLSKVRQEREKFMAKLKQLESDLTLLDNNIGFFANSKNAHALIADVNQKIEDTRAKIEMLKEKIRIIDELDKTEY